MPHRPTYPELLQKSIEACAVFGKVNAVGRRAQDWDTFAVEKFRKGDRRLPAEGNHYTDGFFHFNNRPDIFRRQGFKIKPVRRIIVRRHRFRVVVDHDHIVAHVTQRPDAVHGTVVKFYALADADGAGPEHHDNGLSASREAPCLALLPGDPGIEIGCLRIEFRRTGINHFIGNRKSGSFLPRFFRECHFLHFPEEPPVDLRNGMDFLGIRALFQRTQD